MLLAKIRCELSEIHGTERLFIDIFGHDVQQPSFDVCLFATSLDYVCYAGKWLYRQMKTVAR